MADKTLSYLDYLRLLDIFKHYASTPFINDHVLALRPLGNSKEIEDRLDKIEAALEVIKWDGKIPLTDIPDVSEVLKRLSIEDAILEQRELIFLSGFLRSCKDIIDFLKRAHSRRPFIEAMLERIKPLLPLYGKITRTLNVEGFIEDTASYELSRIRADLFLLRERMRKKLEQIMEREGVRPVLQDSYISLRNGRYVIPMKPNFNEAIQGIVHDYSHSLKTSFVEPVECVEVNNGINMLEKEEEEEEKKILRDLTVLSRVSLNEFESNLKAIKDLDLYHSIALFSLDFKCVRPIVDHGGVLEIRHAVNPFIIISKKGQTVPIDICMDARKKAMIISGPNAGGKTAALKTIGLLSVMAQAGLFIPATGTPLVPMVSQIFAIIGDEQDISTELSSFTAHMKMIKDIYEHARGGDLILIDEIGGGTEPQEASALSMAVMDGFVEKGCTVVVTTHLNLLKAYGYTKAFAVNVATAFDSENMRPMYKLLYGTAGLSNAINVARSIALPLPIIERSEEYLGKQEFMLNDLISSLEDGKEKVYEEQQELARLKAETRKRLSLLKEKKDEYLRTFEEKCHKRFQELEKELDEVRREIDKRERAALRSGKERLAGLRKRFVKAQDLGKGQDQIHVGDYVKVRTLGNMGYVVDIEKETDTCEIVTGNVRTRVKKDYLEKLDRVMAASPPLREHTVHVDVQRIADPEINVMGMRVEEALKELDVFLDRATIQGMPKIRILHGIGTGRLMNAIRTHLTGVGYVKSVQKDERNSGVTIVELS